METDPDMPKDARFYEIQTQKANSSHFLTNLEELEFGISTDLSDVVDVGQTRLAILAQTLGEFSASKCLDFEVRHSVFVEEVGEVLRQGLAVFSAIPMESNRSVSRVT